MSASAREIALPTYTVTVARGAFDRLGEIVRTHAPAHRYALITDSNVGPRYAPRVRAALASEDVGLFLVPAGEEHKTRESWTILTDALLSAGFGRDSVILALGGGVVGDLAGFVAATYMRGIPYVQLPTSLLAMIDASIGGKTGVDTPAGKNLVGAFHAPAAVVADVDVLTTLPSEHLRAGLAEAIKHGVIADAEYFATVAEVASRIPRDDAGGFVEAAGDALTSLVARSIEIKADVVRRDEREGGVRKTLNFGHTLGHAIESCSGYAVLHGEAVAMGMVLESELAEQIGVADAGTAAAVRGAVRRAGLPDAVPMSLHSDELLQATRTDKKSRAGRAEYALPARIGAMAGADRGWSLPVSDEQVLAVLA